MQYDYIVFGSVAFDVIDFLDGTAAPGKMLGGGGPQTYSGVKLYTDSSIFCARVGEEYHQLADEWIEKNKIPKEGFKVVADEVATVYMHYRSPKGDQYYPPEQLAEYIRSGMFTKMAACQHRPSDIEEAICKYQPKGVYLGHHEDSIFWNEIKAIKEKYKFKVMLEYSAMGAKDMIEQGKRDLTRFYNMLEAADIFSLNIDECESLFNVEGDEACISELQKLDVDMSFFRVGARGAYMITKDEVYFMSPVPGPVVDPCGCGNSSTGGAMYAYCEGYSPKEVLAYANVASSMNIRQWGVMKDILGNREEAYELVKKHLDDVKKIK